MTRIRPLKHAARTAAVLALFASSVLVSGCTDRTVAQAQAAAIPSVAPGSGADLAAGRLAILTPTTPFGREEDRQGIALEFAKLLHESRPDLPATPLDSTLSAVNAAGLAAAYGSLYAGYRETGLFGRDNLRKVGAAVGARYLVQIKLAAFDQQSQSRFGWMGVNLLQTQVATVRLFVQIWDSEEGRIAWERSGETVLRERGVLSNSIPLQDAIARVAGGIIREMPA